jgi:hypothetical protein
MNPYYQYRVNEITGKVYKQIHNQVGNEIYFQTIRHNININNSILTQIALILKSTMRKNTHEHTP